MDINKLSSKYKIRKLIENDIDSIYQLSVGNPMYYQYYPPFVTKEIVREDIYALPPNKSNEDKFYIGFFDGDNLVAVMDLILRFPNDQTALIGLFMMNKEYQGKGVGTEIIEECIAYLQELGFGRVRLGYAKGNPQSEAFWTKNGFVKTGEEPEHENCTVVVMERELI